MTEILTESFCERCGTRYTFETARPRNSRLGRARTFTKGVRNFVLSDDPFSVAMAEARGEEERNATALQLDAFHKTFNFCLSCRQYTCGTCWNAEDGRCLTCAPRPGSELAELDAGPDDAAVAARLAALAEPEAPDVGAIGIASWPEADLAQRPATAEADGGAGPELATGAGAAVAGDVHVGRQEAAASGVAELESVPPESIAATVPVAEPVDQAPVDEAPVAGEAEVSGGRVVHGAIQGLRPGESLDEAIAAYEAGLGGTGDAVEAVAPEGESEPGVETVAADATAAEAVHALAVEPEAEPVEAEAAEPAVAVEPERVAVEPEQVAAVQPEPAGAPEPEALLVAENEPVEAATAEPAVAVEPEPVAAAAEPEALEVGVAEPEAAIAAEPEAAIAAEPETVIAAEPESAVAAKPEAPLVAELEPAVTGAPEVAAAEPEALEPSSPAASEPELPVSEPEPAPAIAAVVATPAPEPVAAPAALPEPEPIAATAAPTPSPAPVPLAQGWLTVAPDDGVEPVWPQRVSWPGERQTSADRTFAGRRMVPAGNAASVWAASAREVLEAGPLAGPGNTTAAAAAPSAQPCIGCGLPLSANARFCRRCGARQDG